MVDACNYVWDDENFTSRRLPKKQLLEDSPVTEGSLQYRALYDLNCAQIVILMD